MVDPPPSPLELEVRRIRALMERSDFPRALEAACALRAGTPQNRDVLYLVAVCQRYLGRIQDALATLTELEQLHPQYPRLYQERGHCCVALRDAPGAIQAFERATLMNPSLPASWQALQVLYRMNGRPADADTAAAHLATLAALPREIVTASSMFCDGELHDAERLVRHYLLTHGDHVEAMRLLARIGMELDVVDDAELLLENVMRLAPDYQAARYDYVLALLKRQKHVRAQEEMDKLLATDSENRVYRTTQATIYAGFGDYERALPLYRELLTDSPQDAELHLSIAHGLKTTGKVAESVAAYRAAAAARPFFGEAYWSLANLKTYRFTDAEIARMRADESDPAIRLVDRFHMCFALGKGLEDRGEYAESFAYYERGNALKKTQTRYTPGIVERNARQQMSVCTRELFESRSGSGDSEDAVPIFIIGLPRSGSTLIEQILASHSKVEGTMELADIPRLVQVLRGRENEGESDPRYPRVLRELGAGQLRDLGRQYLTDTRAYRSGKPFFIDKMPNNFRHLGLIELILPNARIIDARREPMACCFSNFKQLFASGQEFTYSLEDIARYYRMYVELMAHWDQVLPGRILRVQHEELVGDLETNVHRLLDFCGLDFEPACLEFFKTERSIRTASSEQVRQPIYREGLDQWRNFEPWLGPLKQALGDAIES